VGELAEPLCSNHDRISNTNELIQPLLLVASAFRTRRSRGVSDLYSALTCMRRRASRLLCRRKSLWPALCQSHASISVQPCIELNYHEAVSCSRVTWISPRRPSLSCSFRTEAPPLAHIQPRKWRVPEMPPSVGRVSRVAPLPQHCAAHHSGDHFTRCLWDIVVDLGGDSWPSRAFRRRDRGSYTL
jgi:hypothetical protein